MRLTNLGSKNQTNNITKIITQSNRIIIERLKSVDSQRESVKNDKPTISMSLSHCIHQTLNSKASTRFHSGGLQQSDRKSGSAGMPRPISYAVFCLKKKKKTKQTSTIANSRMVITTLCI